MTDSQTNLSSNTRPIEARIIEGGPSIAVSGEDVGAGLLHVEATPMREEHLRFADFHEEYTGKYIELADAKAGVTFAVSAGLLAYLMDESKVVDLLRAPAINFRFALVTATVVILALSSSAAFAVVAPRKTSSKADGFVFWGTVAKFPSASAFIKKVAEASDSGMAIARLAHCYDLAGICDKKYSLLRLSMGIGLLGVLMTFAVLLVI